MMTAEVAKSRSEDPWVKVGACVLRKDRSIAGVGYNGVPSGVEIDWSNRDERRQYVIHAEANALRYLMPDEGELIAVTLTPCPSCLTLIASYRIPTVFYRDTPENYDLKGTHRVAKQLGIVLHQV
jgi:dCMP deaminase